MRHAKLLLRSGSPMLVFSNCLARTITYESLFDAVPARHLSPAPPLYVKVQVRQSNFVLLRGNLPYTLTLIH
jgi:hypothetical protein